LALAPAAPIVSAVARRILLLITDLQIGGTPTVVRELATRLHDPPRGVHVEVACLSKWGPVADQLRDAGVTVTALGATRSWELPAVVRRLRRLVRDHATDTVFSFLVHANTAAALSARGLPRVRFFQSIQTAQPRPLWHWWLQGRILGKAERIIVPTQSVVTRARMDCLALVREEQFAVIPNAIDPAAFEGIDPPTGGTPFPIGFLGRLDPVKRVPDLVEAAHRLDGLVRLHIFGEGPERGRIERQIKALGAEGHVTLRGRVARPQDALREIGLLVLPSEAEGFGLVLVEAMAAGVPVVATDVMGIRDVVDNGRTGLLVGVGPESLTGAIRAVVEKPLLRERLARAGREEVVRRFTWGVVLPQYRQVLGLPPA
jgi:glycosyltransferase involved in cell wall biosynthesis